MSKKVDSYSGKCPACKAEGVKLVDMNGLMICEKCSQKKFSSKVRKNIEAAFERQQESNRRQMWMKRMDFAKRGVKAYEEGKVAEALKTFTTYISILESRFSVPPGQLSPSLFTKKEQGELILIAGIYWDLTKIYDHMKGRQSDMRACLNKFIEFSIDRPHIIVSSEGLRRYIASGKAVHVQDFKNAHELLRSKLARCFISSAVYGPDSYETTILRKFRDQRMQNNSFGIWIIQNYYKYSPFVANQIYKSSSIAIFFRILLGPIVKLVRKLVD